MTQSPIEKVLGSFRLPPRPRGNDSNWWDAHCPAHDDRHASLSVGVTDDDKVILHCQTGCPTENVVAALGLQMSDLFPQEEREPQIVALYDYCDEAGVLQYQVVRFDPKRFVQRRPKRRPPRNDHAADWYWNMADMKRVLYRLPELLAADPGQPVFLVEGEKDADRLAREGLVVTTNVGGAGKWKRDYNEALRGRKVVLLPDNDEPGREHARTVERSLQGVAASVRIVELKGLSDKGDVSDWLSQGHTVAELLRLVEQQLPALFNSNGRRPSVQELVARHLGAVESCSHDDLLDANLPPPTWLVEGLVIDEGLTLLGAKKKIGKTWFCLQVAQAIATGSDCLKRKTTQGDVIYLCLEDGKRRLKSRLLKQHTIRGLPITYYTRFPPLDGEGMERLFELLDQRKPRLLIIDTLAAAKTGKTDENAAGSMADLGNALRALAQVYQAGIFATHHHGKLIGGDPGDDLRGSSALAAAGDVNLGLYREQDGHRLRGEGRDIGELSLALTFDPETTWSWLAREDQRQTLRQDADQAIREALHSLGEATAAEVAQLIDRSRQETADRLNRLTAEGQVRVRAERREGRGRPRMLYALALVVVEEPEEDEAEV